MADQAETQSAEQGGDEDSLIAAFTSMRAEQPADAGDDDAGKGVEEVVESDEQQTPAKIRVPALEGDGYDELTPEEIKTQRLMHADYTRKTQAISEQRKAVDAKAREIQTAMVQRLQALDDHVEMLGRAIHSFESQVDWKVLRETDPAGYVAERELQGQRLQQFKTAKQQAEAARKSHRQALAQEETQKLLEAIPEWLDKSTARKEAGEIRAGVSAYGFTPDEFDDVLDHRVIVMAREALEYRRLKEKAAGLKGAVQKAPQLARPGAGGNNGNPAALSAHRDIKRAMQTGSVDDMANAFASIRRQQSK